MEKVSKAELMNALGGKANALTPCEELVVEANQHGSDWGNKEWDDWSERFEVVCK